MKANKSYILLLLSLIFGVQSAMAVLPEKNLNQLVVSLGKELDMHAEDLKDANEYLDFTCNIFSQEIDATEEKLDMAYIVLSSNADDWLLGKVQATSEAHDVVELTNDYYDAFEANMSVLKDHRKTLAAIKKQLLSVNKKSLSKEGLAVLNTNIQKCDSILTGYDDHLKNFAGIEMKFLAVKQKAANLEAITEDSLDSIFTIIFNEPQVCYTGFMDNLAYLFGDLFTYDAIANHRGQFSIAEKENEKDKADRWIHINYAISLLSLLIAFILFRRQKKTSIIRKYSGSLSLVVMFNVFIAFSIITLFVIDPPAYIRNEIILYIQFCIYAALISGLQIITRTEVYTRYILLLYTPQFLLTWFVTTCVTQLFPLSSLTMVLPVVYILYLVVDGIILLFIWKKINHYQRISSAIHFLLVVLCLFVANAGYPVASIIAYLTWFSLFCFILVLYTISTRTTLRNKLKSHSVINYTLKQLIYPIVPVFLIIGSLYWVSDIFNLSSWFDEWLKSPIINIPDTCKMSVWNILHVIILGIVIRFCIKGTEKILLYVNPKKYSSGNAAVAITLLQILVWFIYALFVIVILNININKAGVIAAIGGASIGLGFALRDTFENFFYGFSMMSGRLRPGDIVEYDGLRGTVADVGIMSTSINTEDGPVVSMPNRQLFAKHFINYTLNKQHEIRHIIFDITQESNIDLARELMLKSSQGIPGVVDYENHYVVVKYISCGIVRLDYKCWIDSAKYLRAEPAVREAIYHAFKENGIQIADFNKSMDMRASAKIMEQTPLGK